MANNTLSAAQIQKYNTNPFILDDNYIYISHLDEALRYWVLPCVSDEIGDTLGSNFQATTALGRTAPVYTYSNSGPRTVHISLSLHRDMMEDVNHQFSNATLGYGEDYLDNLLHALQACAVPKYNLTDKAIEPPLVAVRLTNELFIKGVLINAISVTYRKPILSNGKYAQISLGLDIAEIDPYDADSIYTNGSFRGVVGVFKNSGKMGIFKE